MDLDDESLIERIAGELSNRGWTVLDDALPPGLAESLLKELQSAEDRDLKPASVGRDLGQTLAKSVRRDKILWIEGQTQAQKDWMALMGRLRIELNRRLFMGLFSFESHFARYQPGDFYKKHFDAFRGQSNRVLSVVAYLNKDWHADLGGELVMYEPSGDKEICRLLPLHRRVVIFLSEEFPHEVLPGRADRQSIAGWFSINSSTQSQIDPPA